MRYPRSVETNALYFGDNLKVLSEKLPSGQYSFPSESVDLVYLDPPFNSNRNYNLIFKETKGTESEAQIQAFEDTWHWDATARDTFEDITTTGVHEGRIPHDVGRLVDALVRSIGHNDMAAYIVMMAPRLVQLHRVLKNTGSLWLHCDPTASHYLKILLDQIFGPDNFRNEITWKRSDTHNDARHQFPAVSDRLLFYGKSAKAHFGRQYTTHADRTLRDWYQYVELPDGKVRRMSKEERETQLIPEGARRFNADNTSSPNPRPNLMFDFNGYKPHPNGWRYSREKMEELDADGKLLYPATPDGRIMLKRYLDEQAGAVVGDVWTDISQLRGAGKERLGYPTQKPLALLERIIAANSQEGDVVLDPFCGCGTALIAAEKMKRKWVGIDVTHLSIAVIRARLMDSFGLAAVPVFGVPADIESARLLAQESKDGRYEFQWWALSLVDAQPLGERVKGKDKGIDGVLTFSERDSIQRILVSVKSGKPSVLHVKELMATLTDQNGAIGLLIELDPPTQEMRLLAVNADQYESDLWGGSFERIQILTVGELLAGKKPNVPKFLPAYQKAAKIAAAAGEQQVLDLA